MTRLSTRFLCCSPAGHQFKEVPRPLGLCSKSPLRVRPTRSSFRTKAEDFESWEDPLEVQDIDRDYCDDFVCTSSPSVEETIKAFAVDLQRPGRWTLTRFPEDVVYKDPLRSFKGRQKYERLNWISESVERPRVKVSKLQMIERDLAAVDWGFTGKVLGQDVEIGVTSQIKLNLLSGRIMEHTDTWDLGQCSPFASTAFLLSRLLWSLQQARQDTAEALHQLGQKMGIEDEDSSPYIVDPRDPYTFYEKNDAHFKRDALTFLTFVAAMYLVYRAYSFIFQL